VDKTTLDKTGVDELDWKYIQLFMLLSLLLRS